jgi:hypothetical protein
MKNSKHFSEVIESSLNSWTAQCWQWNTFPTYGSIVTVLSNQRTFFGIVHHVQTGSMDPTRYPFPYQKTEEELLREQPQIFEFLKTTFSCLVVGYQEKSKIHYILAPEPAKIHAFVGYADKELTQQFFSDERFLHLVFNAQLPNLDDLLLAILYNQSALGLLTESKLGTFINTFSLLTGNDYRRLKLFLQRAAPLVAE